MEKILSINQISKSYGPIQALKNVSFDVPKGSVFGVLGPNGSGKTTLLATLLDVLKADAGNYTWFDGLHPDEARKQIGSLLETPNFYHYLSSIENLKIAAAIKERGHDDSERVLKLLGLYDRKDSKFQTYSLGMKQRLALASAMLGNPQVLVLDEPTNGLDPAGIAEIRNMIQQLNQQGMTIIMASHLLDEVEKVCTHVAILKKGDLLLSGPVDEVLRSEDQIEVKATDLKALEELLFLYPGVFKVQPVNNILQISCDPSIHPNDINEYCMRHGIILSHLLLKKKSLESKFMELTN